MLITNEGWAVLEDDTHLSRWIEERGDPACEGFCNQVLCRLIREGWHCLDGGACLGDHTVAYARKVGASGGVIAFEPLPESYECLVYNTKGFSNVTCHNFALGATQTTVYLARDKNVGATHIVDRMPAGDSKPVPVCNLDALGLNKLDYMKLDLEGYEYEALLGAMQTIIRLRPSYIVTEINHGALDRAGTSAESIYSLMSVLRYEHRYGLMNEVLQYDEIFCQPQLLPRTKVIAPAQ